MNKQTANDPAPRGDIFSQQRLRCSACGAPYQKPPSAEILTCDYCGTSQRVVDAREFLDHFMAQVTAFVRQAVPAGLDLGGSSTTDPVARLAAFNASIRPRLSTESDQCRFNCFQLLASPLAVLPFAFTGRSSNGADPAAVSMFAAKVQSVSALAVDDSSRILLRRASGLASCYQSLLVASRLSGSGQPERHYLISQNYETASEAIDSTGGWPALTTRLAGLKEQSQAVDLLLTGGKHDVARKTIASAELDLKLARSMLETLPDLGYMTTAVEQELAIVRTTRAMIDLAEYSPRVPPHPLAYLQRLSGMVDWVSRSAPTDWSATFRSVGFREAIFQRASELRAAQGGCGGVKALPAGGGTFVPFWVVELPYNFETGVLWAKKGKEVPEMLLVAATFPSELSTLSGAGVSRVVTDVFAPLRAGRPLDDFYQRISGKEQRISDSGGLPAILRSATQFSLPGQQAIPPLATEFEALRLVRTYIDEVRSVNPKAAAQLRASSPRVLDLVYLPCVLHASPPIPWLGPWSPASVGDTRQLLGFVS
jgi:hypothetical protein